MSEAPARSMPAPTIWVGIVLAIFLAEMAFVAVLSFDAGYRMGDLTARIEHLKNNINKTAAQIKKTRAAIERTAP